MSDEVEAAFCPKFTAHSNSAKHWSKNFVELITTGDKRSLFTDNPIFPNERKEADCNTLLFGGVWALWHFVYEFHLLGSDKVDKQNSPRLLHYSKINKKRQ